MKINESNGEIYDESVVNNIMEEIYKEVNSHSEKIARIETKIENLIEQVDKLDSIDKAITKISLVIERNEIDNAKRDKLIQDQSALLAQLSNTIEKINSNLDNLNDEQNKIQENLVKLETKVDEKIEVLETEIKTIDNKTKVDVVDLIKKYGIQVICAGYLLWQSIEQAIPLLNK